jgi:hypothetical protein
VKGKGLLADLRNDSYRIWTLKTMMMVMKTRDSRRRLGISWLRKGWFLRLGLSLLSRVRVRISRNDTSLAGCSCKRMMLPPTVCNGMTAEIVVQ